MLINDPVAELPNNPDSSATPKAVIDVGADRAKLEELCQRHYQHVHDRVHRMLARDLRRGRPWLSALLSTGDVVHEVFLGVVRDFDRFRGESEQAFVAYLARLVRNRLIDSVRHHEASRRDHRLIERETSTLVDPDMTPSTGLTHQEDAELVSRILGTFPERDRALLRGRLEDEESFPVLAKSLGYASADSARKAFASVQARMMARIQIAKESRS